MIGLQNNLQLWSWEMVREFAAESEKPKVRAWSEVYGFVTEDETSLGVSADIGLVPFPLTEFLATKFSTLLHHLRGKLQVDDTVQVPVEEILSEKDAKCVLREISKLMRTKHE